MEPPRAAVGARTLTSGPKTLGGAIVSPRGDWVAIADFGQNVIVEQVATGKRTLWPLPVFEGKPDYAAKIARDASGQRIVVATTRQFRILAVTFPAGRGKVSLQRKRRSTRLR